MLACPRPTHVQKHRSDLAVLGRGPRLWSIGRQTEMTQDALHRGAVLDEREEAQPPATAGTRQHVEPEGPAHQLGPQIRTGSPAGCCVGWLCVARRVFGRGRRVGAWWARPVQATAAARQRARGASTP